MHHRWCRAHTGGVARTPGVRAPSPMDRVHCGRETCTTGDATRTSGASGLIPGNAPRTLATARATPASIGTIGHILRTVLKMKYTVVSSLYIRDIAIIHLLIQCKRILHVRLGGDTKSGPKTLSKDGEVVIFHTFLRLRLYSARSIAQRFVLLGDCEFDML